METDLTQPEAIAANRLIYRFPEALNAIIPREEKKDKFNT